MRPSVGLRVPVVLVTVVAAIAGMAGSSPASAGGSGGTWTRGVSLTIHLSRTTYPRDALAAIPVTLHNGSDHPVVLRGVCTGQNPSIRVSTTRGRAVYPPALHFPPAPDTACGTGSGPRLLPGTRLEGRVVVVLRGATLQPRVTIVTPSGSRVSVAGPTVQVRLVPSPSLPMVVTEPPHVSALITKPHGTRGALLYQGWTACRVPGLSHPWYSADWTWAPRSGSRVYPFPYPAGACRGLLAWHAVLGWIGYPVASIVYAAPASSPSP
ncbi:MAG TPA: hypothetical protein VFB58_12740 [Chloroflexota bacterium]|nr:hypothetical protein [Chloroflexota bacterium]